MLPMHPKSVVSLFFDIIKSTKRLFIRMSPILMIAIIANLMVSSPAYGKSLPFTIIGMVFAILGMISFYWAISFAYEVLIDQGINYKNSLKVTLKNFWRVLIVIVPIIVFVALMAGVALGVIYFFPAFKSVDLYLNIPSMTVLVFLLLFSSSFFWGFTNVYMLEVLVKNTKVFPAMAKALKVSLRVSSLLRVCCLYLLLLLIALLVLAVLAGGIFLLAWINIGSIALVTISILCGSVLLLYLETLFAVFFIYLYNDLLLRYEDRV